MKKRFTFILLAVLCLGFAGCSDDKEDPENGIKFLETDVKLSRGDSNLIWFNATHEEYTVSTTQPEIAEVSIQLTLLGPAVLVKALKEGDAVITVTDIDGTTAQCSLTIEYSDISFWGSSLRVNLNSTFRQPIIGGSGSFVATIADPDIADVSITDWELLITTKKEGETKITVTDTEKNKSASLTLTVKEGGYQIVAVRYAVDAEQKEAIEKDLRDRESYAVGTTFYFNDPGFVIKTPDGTELSKGTFSHEETDTPSSYGIPVDNQIYVIRKFTFKFSDKEQDYNMIVVRGGFYYFCEDLTAYYKAKYPDAGVKQVGRGLITQNNWSIQ